MDEDMLYCSPHSGIAVRMQRRCYVKTFAGSSEIMLMHFVASIVEHLVD